MGKNSAIQLLGKSIGLVVVHKLLLKYTKKPESLNHLKYEVEEYGDVAIDKAKGFIAEDISLPLSSQRQIRQILMSLTIIGMNPIKKELKKKH